jgi:hypothetical protein
MLLSRTPEWVFITNGYLQTLIQSLQNVRSVSCSVDGVVTLLGPCIPSASGILY